jgi:hypothetical protein
MCAGRGARAQGCSPWLTKGGGAARRSELTAIVVRRSPPAMKKKGVEVVMEAVCEGPEGARRGWWLRHGSVALIEERGQGRGAAAEPCSASARRTRPKGEMAAIAGDSCWTRIKLSYLTFCANTWQALIASEV